MTTVTALPSPPSRDDPATFSSANCSADSNAFNSSINFTRPASISA